QSYAVKAACLTGISQLDPQKSIELAKKYESDKSDVLVPTIVELYSENGNSGQWEYVFSRYQMGNTLTKSHLVRNLSELAGKVDNPVYARQGIEAIKRLGIDNIKLGVAEFIVSLLNDIKQARIKLKDNVSANIASDAIK